MRIRHVHAVNLTHHRHTFIIQANDSLGMAMIFTLACHLKERLDATVNERVNTRKEAAEQRRKAEEDVGSWVHMEQSL